MAGGSNQARLKDCYIDFTCGIYKKGDPIFRHDNALIGTRSDGKVVVRSHCLQNEKEVGFTVELRNAGHAFLAIESREILRAEINELLDRHNITHSPGYISIAVDEYIKTDTAHCQKIRGRMNPSDQKERNKAAKDHFENRTDISYKIPVEDLVKLAGAIDELRSMSLKPKGTRTH